MDNWEIYNYLKSKNGGNSEDSATLHALIDKSITEISNDRVTTIGYFVFDSCPELTTVNLPNVTNIKDYAFRRCPELTTVNLPNVTKTGIYAFSSCPKLITVDFPNITDIGNYTFMSCSKLTTLILRKNRVVTLGGTTVFTSTAIRDGTGYIYVPDDLVESYKTATNWSTYANQIRGLSELPE